MINRYALRHVLRERTGCQIQHDGWPCGTCFFSISKRLTNAHWQAVLGRRGDYARQDLDNLPRNLERALTAVITLATGRRQP